MRCCLVRFEVVLPLAGNFNFSNRFSMALWAAATVQAVTAGKTWWPLLLLLLLLVVVVVGPVAVDVAVETGSCFSDVKNCRRDSSFWRHWFLSPSSTDSSSASDSCDVTSMIFWFSSSSWVEGHFLLSSRRSSGCSWYSLLVHSLWLLLLLLTCCAPERSKGPSSSSSSSSSSIACCCRSLWCSRSDSKKWLIWAKMAGEWSGWWWWVNGFGGWKSRAAAPGGNPSDRLTSQSWDILSKGLFRTSERKKKEISICFNHFFFRYFFTLFFWFRIFSFVSVNTSNTQRSLARTFFLEANGKSRSQMPFKS